MWWAGHGCGGQATGVVGRATGVVGRATGVSLTVWSS